MMNHFRNTVYYLGHQFAICLKQHTNLYSWPVNNFNPNANPSTKCNADLNHDPNLA